MGCLLRTILVLVVVGVVAVLGYNYFSGRGFTLQPPPAAGGIDTDAAKKRGAELTQEAAEKAGEAATRIEEAVNEGALTAKIKSKMALDDYVKARVIDVDTSGSVVTLRGIVQSDAERDRAVRLARETQGVTRVVDELEVRPATR